MALKKGSGQAGKLQIPDQIQKRTVMIQPSLSSKELKATQLPGCFSLHRCWKEAAWVLQKNWKVWYSAKNRASASGIPIAWCGTVGYAVSILCVCFEDCEAHKLCCVVGCVRRGAGREIVFSCLKLQRWIGTDFVGWWDGSGTISRHFWHAGVCVGTNALLALSPFAKSITHLTVSWVSPV